MSTHSQTVGNSKAEITEILHNTKRCRTFEEKRTPAGAADSAPDDSVQ